MVKVYGARKLFSMFPEKNGQHGGLTVKCFLSLILIQVIPTVTVHAGSFAHHLYFTRQCSNAFKVK